MLCDKLVTDSGIVCAEQLRVLNCTPWAALQLKCWGYTRFWWNRVSRKRHLSFGENSSSALQLAHRQGTGSFETRGSSIAGDSILGVHRTITTTESAQCEQRGRCVDEASLAGHVGDTVRSFGSEGNVLFDGATCRTWP